jgi:hypothetical protein
MSRPPGLFAAALAKSAFRKSGKISPSKIWPNQALGRGCREVLLCELTSANFAIRVFRAEARLTVYHSLPSKIEDASQRNIIGKEMDDSKVMCAWPVVAVFEWQVL